MPDEEIFHGNAPALASKFEKEERKGEFVVVIEGKETKQN